MTGSLRGVMGHGRKTSLSGDSSAGKVHTCVNGDFGASAAHDILCRWAPLQPLKPVPWVSPRDEARNTGERALLPHTSFSRRMDIDAGHGFA